MPTRNMKTIISFFLNQERYTSSGITTYLNYKVVNGDNKHSKTLLIKEYPGGW